MAANHSDNNICLETDMDSTATSIIIHPQPASCCTKAVSSEKHEKVPSEVVDSTMDKLLTKIKSEAMFELRKLKHQQRPVSEFGSKQQLEEFFGKRMPPPQLDVSAASQSSASSLVSDRAKQLTSASTNSQDFMPQGVRLEVRGVFEQHRVTETLQGPLQQEMNRVLQQNIERSQGRQQGRRTRSRTMHHNELDNASDRLIAAIRTRHRHRPRVAASPRHPRRHVRFVPPENGRYPMPRRNQSQIVDSLIQSPALNSLDAEAREEIVSEVRNLVQQQLVTSALSGEFRGVLELNIQQRANLTQQGASGEDVIRSLRQGRTSPTSRADREPMEHSSGASYSELHHDVREVKSQLADLKQMMRVSFDLQLDIQRSIRQEVAAALSAFLAPQQQHAGSGGAGLPLQPPQACPIPTLSAPEGYASVVQATSQTVHVPVVECGRCTICSDGVIDSVVYRCGHMCMCMSCGLELKSKGLKCPICRAPITDVIRAYTSMM